MPAMAIPARLRPYLRSAVGYHEVLAPHALHHGLPSPFCTVILAFDEPMDCGWLRGREDRDRYWTSVAGLHSGPALIRTHGFQHGIQLSLTPAGLRALFGLPASAMVSTIARGDDLSYGMSHVHARLAEAPDWPSRWLLLTAALEEICRPESGPPAEVSRAWHVLTASGGTARIGDVADHVGWGRRRLLNAFRAEYGLSPKEAAMVIRFHRAISAVRAGHGLTQVAADSGYADQAHLTRDFVALGGGTPTALRDPWSD